MVWKILILQDITHFLVFSENRKQLGHFSPQAELAQVTDLRGQGALTWQLTGEGHRVAFSDVQGAFQKTYRARDRGLRKKN